MSLFHEKENPCRECFICRRRRRGQRRKDNSNRIAKILCFVVCIISLFIILFIIEETDKSNRKIQFEIERSKRL